MNSEPPDRDPDTEPFRKIGTGDRRRAALLLGLLAIAAVLFVAIMVYTLGSSDGSSDHPTLAGPDGPAVTVTGAVPTTTVHRSATRPRPSVTTPRPVSCPTSAPCALPDDVGNVGQALNAYRAARGQPPVTASVTRMAQNCALNEGDGSACPSSYFWEPVGRSGTEVIDKIAASPTGVGWLLDPGMTAVQIGWVYLPSSKSYECVLVSNA
jgi:hypothetical protein